MPIFLFKAITKNSQTGQPLPIPAGTRSGLMLIFPGNLEQCKQYLRSQHFGPPTVKYFGVELPYSSRVGFKEEIEVLLVEVYLGVPMPMQQPQMSAAHVNGGQPIGAPLGNMAQNRPSGQKDSSGFQTLGDDVLSGAGEAFFGDANDGTSTDLYGGGHVEVPRQT